MSLGWVIIPRFDSINSLMTSITKVKSETKTVKDKITYLSSVNEGDLTANESYLSSAVLQEKNSYLLVGVIRNIADKFNYQVKSFTINPIKIIDSSDSLKVSDNCVATKMPVNLVLEGPENNMVDLLISMENSLPIIFIDDFSVFTKSGTDELTLTVSSYYIADNTNSFSGNLSLSDLTLTSEEQDLLSTISQFNRSESLTNTLSEQSSTEKTYMDYNRSDPFTL